MTHIDAHGARRIYSSNAAGVVSAAFMNPDGSKALIVFNANDATNSFRVSWGAEFFDGSVPAKSGASFTWSGTQDGSYTVPAASMIRASSYNDISGLQTETTSDESGGFNVGFATDGGYAHYRNIEFNANINQIQARVANGGTGGNAGAIEFHLDSPDGTLVASVAVAQTGGWQSWRSVSSSASGVAGVHDLYVVFKGSGPIGNLNWFQFAVGG